MSKTSDVRYGRRDGSVVPWQHPGRASYRVRCDGGPERYVRGTGRPLAVVERPGGSYRYDASHVYIWEPCEQLTLFK